MTSDLFEIPARRTPAARDNALTEPATEWRLAQDLMPVKAHRGLPERSRTPPLTPAQEDYLACMAQLSRDCRFVHVKDLAGALDHSLPSASVMLRRLEACGMIRRAPPQLTLHGRRHAQAVLHRRRILTDLFRAIGVPPRSARQDIAGLEHCLSQQTANVLADLVTVLREDQRARRGRAHRNGVRARRACALPVGVVARPSATTAAQA